MFAILLLLLACISGANKNVVLNSSIADIPNNSNVVLDAIPYADTISINAVGDIMFGSNFPDNTDMPADDGRHLLKPFKEYLADADIVFGNVEGVFLNNGGTPKGFGNQVYCFRQPEIMAKNYTDYGFNLLSVANNHAADFGETGISNTDSVLTKSGIAFCGSLSRRTTTISIRNNKIGMAAFAPHKGCVDMNNMDNAVRTVKNLKQACNIVIVSFHGGAEGVSRQHVPRKTEIFYGQNRGNVYEFAHKVIDAGADVVLGHGPHVVRSVELYKNKFIAYSLGNFCTYGKFSLRDATTNAPLLKLRINGDGDFISGQIISGKQFGNGGPAPDEENKAAFNTVKNLTRQDFPETDLVFNDGKIGRNKN